MQKYATKNKTIEFGGTIINKIRISAEGVFLFLVKELQLGMGERSSVANPFYLSWYSFFLFPLQFFSFKVVCYLLKITFLCLPYFLLRYFVSFLL